MKRFRALLGLLALGVLALSLGDLLSDAREKAAGASLNRHLQTSAVRVAEPTLRPAQATEAPAETVPAETAPIAVDFSLLRQTNPDTVAWLYCPDTPIDLPVVQGTDNEYYLCHLFDGTPNNTGTLFVDAQNAGDFSQPITIIYGHNLKNGTMFGTLSRYKSAEYYEEHPTFWLLTQAGNYRIDLTAGCLLPCDDPLYAVGHTGEQALKLVTQAMEHSTFPSQPPPSQEDRFLLLSTCSYEFQNARYVLIGKMTPVG